MKKNSRQYGFSLIETLMAVGTLAIGMTFIAGTFMTGIYFSTISTERTIAATVAEEAFAKIQLYGLGSYRTTGGAGYVPYEQLVTIPREEYLYPSTRQESERQYSWAALCFRSDSEPSCVRCVVFVCRQTVGSRYWVRKSGAVWPQPLEYSDLPRPLKISIVGDLTNDGLIQDAVPTDGVDERAFINDGSIIVSDAMDIYRVLERYADQPDKIKVDHPFLKGTWDAWVIPAPASGGRNPVVAVYQKVLRVPGP